MDTRTGGHDRDGESVVKLIHVFSSYCVWMVFIVGVFSCIDREG